MSKSEVRFRENLLKNQIMQYLRLKRIFAWRQNTGAFIMQDKGRKRFIRCGIAGLSDIIGILPGGKFLAIELKVPGGRLTKAQKNFLEMIRKNNGIAIVAFCLDDVMEVIEREINEALHGNKIHKGK